MRRERDVAWSSRNMKGNTTSHGFINNPLKYLANCCGVSEIKHGVALLLEKNPLQGGKGTSSSRPDALLHLAVDYFPIAAVFRSLRVLVRWVFCPLWNNSALRQPSNISKVLFGVFCYEIHALKRHVTCTLFKKKKKKEIIDRSYKLHKWKQQNKHGLYVIVQATSFIWS